MEGGVGGYGKSERERKGGGGNGMDGCMYVDYGVGRSLFSCDFFENLLANSKWKIDKLRYGTDSRIYDL